MQHPFARILLWLVFGGTAACTGERIALGDGPIDARVVVPDGSQGGSGADPTEPTDEPATEPTPAPEPSDGPTPEPTDEPATEPTEDASTADAGTDGPTDDADAGDSDPCVRGATSADEVVWIGDSWFTIPGNQRTRVRDLARAAGLIGAADDYPSLAAPASSLDAIVGQYRSRRGESSAVKVLIMNGGTWDTILANGSEASVAQVLNTFERFLVEVAGDGTVEHIIYMLNPELPSIPGVAALRPGLTAACASSEVPCYFLDLQPLWAGRPEYTARDGIQASEVGGEVIADQIWAIMQDNCIAQ